MSSADLRRVSSRALRAASRAAAASATLPITVLASAGCSSSHCCSLSLTPFSTTGRTSDETSLSLVWEENFGSGTFTDSTQVRPSRVSSPRQLHLLALQDAALLGIVGHLPRQRGAEPGEVRAAVALRDVVGEAEHVLVVAVVPPHRHLDGDPVALRREHDRLRDQRRLGGVEIAHEGLEPALVVQLHLDRLGVAQVAQDDAHARVEEGELAQPVLQRLEVELDHGEGLGRGQEGDLGARAAFIGAGLHVRHVGAHLLAAAHRRRHG